MITIPETLLYANVFRSYDQSSKYLSKLNVKSVEPINKGIGKAMMAKFRQINRSKDVWRVGPPKGAWPLQPEEASWRQGDNCVVLGHAVPPRVELRVLRILVTPGSFWLKREASWVKGLRFHFFWYQPMSWHQFSRMAPNFDFCCPFWAF